MYLIRGLHNLRPFHRGCVATIGNFDGVHLGHQSVMSRLLDIGRSLELPATVITFEPQAGEFFRPESAPARLTRLREKLAVMRELGIDRVLLIQFNRHLAEMPAEDFVTKLLVNGLGVQYLSVGDDFRFGKDRRGDYQMLLDMGRTHSFDVEDMNTLTLDSDRVSSTRIREALDQGELDAAGRLLGRPYRICGRVAHGDKRGRTIGFPTLNINLHRRRSPLHGVYAVRVSGLEMDQLPGVANIGTRPTKRGEPRYLLEVHLFDYDQEVYGHLIQVEFARKLRDEKKFPSFDDLRTQIFRDADEARAYLGVAK